MFYNDIISVILNDMHKQKENAFKLLKNINF